MVLADGGLLACDEFDKMSEVDRSSIHDALERQQVMINKAGVRTTLNSRTSLLAAANPKHGRYRVGRTVAEQFNLSIPIITRMLVFAIVDMPDETTDKNIADRIVESRYRTAKHGWPVLEDGTVLDADFWKKYQLVSRTVNPRITDPKVQEYVRNVYWSIREQGIRWKERLGEEGARTITPRQILDILRLAEASARARLEDEITMDDVKLATEIVRTSLRTATGSQDGEITDMVAELYSGMKRSQIGDMEAMESLIREMSANEPDRIVEIGEVVKVAEKEGIKDIPKVLKKLEEEGSIYYPRLGFVGAI